MKRLTNRFGLKKRNKGDKGDKEDKGNKGENEYTPPQAPQIDYPTPQQDDYNNSHLGMTHLSHYDAAIEAPLQNVYEQSPSSPHTNPQNGGSASSRQADPSGPISVDSPDTSPGSSAPSSPTNSSTYNFSPDRVGQKKPPLPGSSGFGTPPVLPQSVHRTSTPPTELTQLGQESFSSIFSDGENLYPKGDVRYLQSQLRDAHHVVKTVMGVERVDRNSCLKATLQYSTMQKELEQLRENHKTSLAAQQELEAQLTQARMESSQHSASKASLERTLQKREISEPKELHSDRRLSASSSLADHVSGDIMESEEYFTKSYEEHLESQLASMRELLGERKTEVDKLQEELQNEKGQGNQASSTETVKLKRELQEAQDEIAELEKEQQLNMAEIVTLSRKVRDKGEMSNAMGKGGNKELEQNYRVSQMRVEELEEERDMRIKTQEELSKQLNEAQTQLSKYKDADSDMDYPQRVALLEKRLEKKNKQNVKSLVKKDEEIEKVKAAVKEQKLQASSWEKSANESSEQVMKMASHMSENQEYLATLEEDVRELVAHLEEAETKIAELEDKHWMRDQKLSGMETMYHDSQRKIKMLAGENESIRSSFTVERSTANSLRAESTVTSMNRSVREEEALRKIEFLSRDLEESAQKIEKVSIELESSRTKEAATRNKVEQMKKEKDALEQQVADVESQLRTLENRRSSQESFTMGLEAKQVAVQAKMLKLEQENKTLRRNLDKMDTKIRSAEKKNKSKNDALSIGSEESLDLNMQLQASRSAMNTLQMELVETKLKIEETERELENEKKLHASNVQRLTKDLENSEADKSLHDDSFGNYLSGKHLKPIRSDSMREDFMGDDSSVQLSLGESLSETAAHNEAATSNDSVETNAHIRDLKAQLAAKEEQLRRKEEDYAMQVDQVDGLRERLQETLTSLEDLEFQQNFNNAKVTELTRLSRNEDDGEPQEMLLEKAIQVADLETRLERAEKKAAERKILIEKLEQESSMNKAKVAELSAIWESQAKDQKARNSVLMKAIEVSELLDQSNQRIEQLEIEKGEIAGQYAALNLKLAQSMQMVNELGEKLEKEQKAKEEMEQIMEASGIQIFDMESDNGDPNARKRAISIPNASALNAQESDRIMQLEETLSHQQAVIASLARNDPANPILNEEYRDETASSEKCFGRVSGVVALINESGISALSTVETEEAE